MQYFYHKIVITLIFLYILCLSQKSKMSLAEDFSITFQKPCCECPNNIHKIQLYPDTKSQKILNDKDLAFENLYNLVKLCNGTQLTLYVDLDKPPEPQIIEKCCNKCMCDIIDLQTIKDEVSELVDSHLNPTQCKEEPICICDNVTLLCQNVEIDPTANVNFTKDFNMDKYISNTTCYEIVPSEKEPTHCMCPTEIIIVDKNGTLNATSQIICKLEEPQKDETKIEVVDCKKATTCPELEEYFCPDCYDVTDSCVYDNVLQEDENSLLDLVAFKLVICFDIIVGMFCALLSGLVRKLSPTVFLFGIPLQQ